MSSATVVEPVFGAAELRAVENLLDALEARGIVFARPHGGEGGLERVSLSRAALVGLALGTGADLREVDLTGVKYNEETRWPVGFTPPASA